MKSFIIWMISILITLAGAVYQRWTGPSYPLSGKIDINGKVIPFRLPRSHGGAGNQVVIVPASDGISGWLHWRRYRTGDPMDVIKMDRTSEGLAAELPHQPPAGKLEYYLILKDHDRAYRIPEEGHNPIIRFRGDVPPVVLVPHIILMFMSMLFSNRILIGYLLYKEDSAVARWTVITVILMFFGGMMLGPMIQVYAFGQAWTGFPLGSDLTDNKTAAAFILWLIPFIKVLRKKRTGAWALIASLAMLVIFLIPHSLFGSELNY